MAAGVTPWSSPPPANQLELLRGYERAIRRSYASGEYEPVVWPYRSWGFFVLLAYLLLPPSRSRLLRLAKYPVFAYFVYWSVRCSLEARSLHMHGSYGVGLINSWSVVWMAAVVIFKDSRETAERLERRGEDVGANGDGGDGVGSAGKVGGGGEAIASRSVKSGSGGKAFRRTNIPEVSAEPATGKANTSDVKRPDDKQTGGKQTRGKRLPPSWRVYVWQKLPADLWHRFIWIYDLAVSFRGAGWKHQISNVPRPPAHVRSSLPGSPSPDASHISRRSPSPDNPIPTRSTVIRHNLWLLLGSFVVVDWWKTFAMRDPYFWGFDTAPPPTFLPDLVRSSAVLTRCWRLLVSLAGVYAGITFVGTLNALFYLGLCPSFLIGDGTANESWQYVDMYGSPRVLLAEGLAGWWGRFWHQLFRIGFAAPTKAALSALGWSGRSTRGKALGTAVAFALSGALHASGSYTSWPHTKPLRPMAFFLLQGVGVAVEDAARTLLRRAGVAARTPAWLAQATTLSWVVLFLYFTGGLLAEDFAKAGIWLFEPFPVSVFRGLGYGLPEEGWWCWGGTLVWWHSSDVWYKSGIAL